MFHTLCGTVTFGSNANPSTTACNGTIVVDTEMGEVIQLQGDQRKDVQEFLTDKKEGLELDAKTIKVNTSLLSSDKLKLTITSYRSMVSKPIESRPTSHCHE